ncbi:MAG: thymidylate synthase [Dehalococcoidia bacterium]|nr:MAG: thymidylate synthase [Dehalococcoidia bacterium]
MKYKELSERTLDSQYRELLKRIKTEGEKVFSQQDEESLMVLGHQMRFKLANGFPIITERDLISAAEGRPSQFQMAIGELCAFLNGARTLEEMKKFGCGWWSRWVTAKKCAKRGLEPGDLGPGSYGPAWRNFPTAEGKPFDQITHLIEQINELPQLRTHIVTPWIPQYLGRGQEKQQKVVVVPCHGFFHVVINTYTNELSLHHFQRSADVPVGLVFNLIQYAALTLMIAQVTGYKPKEFVYTTSDTHIFLSQMNDVDEILLTNPQTFPTVMIDSTIKDIFAFRPEHFKVMDYKPQLPRRTIWTPV